MKSKNTKNYSRNYRFSSTLLIAHFLLHDQVVQQPFYINTSTNWNQLANTSSALLLTATSNTNYKFRDAVEPKKKRKILSKLNLLRCGKRYQPYHIWSHEI